MEKCHPCISIFFLVICFIQDPYGREEKQIHITTTIMLKCKVFNIYLWEGNMGLKKTQYVGTGIIRPQGDLQLLSLLLESVFKNKDWSFYSAEELAYMKQSR